jgi:hypothetical protein
MFLPQLLAPIPGATAAAKRRAAVVKARDELIAAVADKRASSSSTRRRRADAAVAALAALAADDEQLLRLDLNVLGPEPFQVVYASGGFPLWRTTAEIAERVNNVFVKRGRRRAEAGDGGDEEEDGDDGSSSSSGGGGVVASQQFDPRTRALVNRVVYGPFAVSAFGQFAPVEEEEEDGDAAPPRLPARVRADVQGGALEFSKSNKSIGLPFIRGQGLFEVLYADRDVRVFRSPGPGGVATAAISVQMPLLLPQEAAGAERRWRKRRT